MGACQSHPGKRNSGHFNVDDGDHVPFGAKGGTPHRRAKSIKSTSGGGTKSAAYDLRLVSPSERTAVTDALSPTSMYSPTFTDISPIKNKENHFDLVIKVDNNDHFPADDGLKHLFSCPSTDSFSDPEYTGIGIETGIGVEKKEIFKEEDNIGVTYGFTDSLATREQESTEWDQNIDSLSPVTNQRLEGNSIESMARSSQANLDSPPLLAPPNDMPIVMQSSNTYTAVNPAVVATFNRMKKEVKELQKQEKQRRQEEKIKDRRQDIQGYTELWGEYNEIQKRVIKQRTESPSPNKKGETISLTDAHTWFVDFSALQSADHLDQTGAVDDSETADEKEEEKKQTKLPFLLESSAYYSRRDSFGLEELWQRKTPGANQAVPNMADTSSSSQLDIFESTASSRSHFESDSSENDDNCNIPDTMALDLGSRSLVSDLGNGSNSSLSSEIEKAVSNNDYGVLRRYSRKGMKSTVPTHTENFNSQLGNQNPANVGLPSARKSFEENNSTLSFSKYLAKNCLPSVSIENAETGLIRWRESPKKDVDVEEAGEMGEI